MPTSSIDPNNIAADLATAWSVLGDALADGWAATAPGVTAAATGVAVAELNPVIVTGPVEAADVERLLDRMVASGLPHSLTARPRWATEVEAIARHRGLRRSGDGPLMALRLDARAPVADDPRLAFRTVGPDEAPLLATVAGAAFDAPPALMLQLVSPAALARPEISAYVGALDGEPVTTALAVRTGDTVGFFDVGTIPSRQRQGLGEAMMDHALGHSAASVAWLQSSPAGLGLYRRMGFATLEDWPTWDATP